MRATLEEMRKNLGVPVEQEVGSGRDYGYRSTMDSGDVDSLLDHSPPQNEVSAGPPRSSPPRPSSSFRRLPPRPRHGRDRSAGSSLEAPPESSPPRQINVLTIDSQFEGSDRGTAGWSLEPANDWIGLDGGYDEPDQPSMMTMSPSPSRRARPPANQVKSFDHPGPSRSSPYQPKSSYHLRSNGQRRSFEDTKSSSQVQSSIRRVKPANDRPGSSRSCAAYRPRSSTHLRSNDQPGSFDQSGSSVHDAKPASDQVDRRASSGQRRSSNHRATSESGQTRSGQPKPSGRSARPARDHQPGFSDLPRSYHRRRSIRHRRPATTKTSSDQPVSSEFSKPSHSGRGLRSSRRSARPAGDERGSFDHRNSSELAMPVDERPSSSAARRRRRHEPHSLGPSTEDLEPPLLDGDDVTNGLPTGVTTVTSHVTVVISKVISGVTTVDPPSPDGVNRPTRDSSRDLEVDDVGLGGYRDPEREDPTAERQDLDAEDHQYSEDSYEADDSDEEPLLDTLSEYQHKLEKTNIADDDSTDPVPLPRRRSAADNPKSAASPPVPESPTHDTKSSCSPLPHSYSEKLQFAVLEFPSSSSSPVPESPSNSLDVSELEEDEYLE